MKGSLFAASNFICLLMGIYDRWKRIADAILACMAAEGSRPEDCTQLADVLNAMQCGVLLHMPGQMAPMFYNTTVQQIVGKPAAVFGTEELTALLPRLTMSAMSNLQVYGIHFGQGGAGAMRFQCALLDECGTERMYFGMSQRLEATDASSAVLTVFYDLDVLLETATDDQPLLDALTPDQSRAFSTLTDREKEVLALVAHHLRSQEIAKQLCIAPQTVQTHRKNLLRKLGVRTAYGLAPFIPLLGANG